MEALTAYQLLHFMPRQSVYFSLGLNFAFLRSHCGILPASGLSLLAGSPRCYFLINFDPLVPPCGLGRATALR
jgi:hypothetical protein